MKDNLGLDIRDLRQKDQYITDDQFLNGYARFVGIYAVGVYGSFCRHANKDQNCWPSINKIQEELDIGRNSVIDAIKKLEFWNIIKKLRIGKTANNRYWLLHKREWKPISEVYLKDFSEVCGEDFTSLLRKLHQFATQTSKKGDTSKETHSKEIATPSVAINPLIELFKTVNPSYEQLFKNTTQRKAMLRLVEKHGLEKIQWIIGVLEKTNTMPFSPSIQTPLQLESKLGQLLAFISKEKIKVESQKNIVIKI